MAGFHPARDLGASVSHPASSFIHAHIFCSILYRRASRLRRITGNPKYKSLGEIEAAQMTLGEAAQMTLIRPFILGFREPIVFLLNLYVALAYGMSYLACSRFKLLTSNEGILYVFITSFNVVFTGNHGFNLGENGLAFMVNPSVLNKLKLLLMACRVCSSELSSPTPPLCHTPSTYLNPSSKMAKKVRDYKLIDSCQVLTKP